MFFYLQNQTHLLQPTTDHTQKMAMKMESPKSAICALIFFFSLFLTLCLAFAASGGRMGGDSFSEQSPPPPPHDHHYHDRYHYHHHSRGHSSSSSRYEKEQRGGRNKNDDLFAIIVPAGMIGAFSLFVYIGYLNNRGSVLTVQVGLTGNARSLQKELNEIAQTADTSSSKGWQLILTETVTALLRHPQYYISGYSSVKRCRNAESLEKSYRELSNEERHKFDMESLVNVNNVKRRREVIPKSSKFDKDYIVVTILVAAKGSYKVPVIKSIDDMKDALRSLSIGSSNLQAVEVLWTPQDKNDTLSDEELLENYPLLRPI